MSKNEYYCHSCDTVVNNGTHECFPEPPTELGRKQDAAKPRWSLLPADTIPEVIDVLEFGAQKYAPGNWAHVPDARTRYYDAMMRHIESWWRGEKVDLDSGKPHLAHACCCILFLMAFDKVKTND